jgi:DNA-binding NtrC family response regulator
MMETYSGRIVIAEDEDNIRAGLRDVLGKDGHVITDVGSGEEALAALATNPFDTAIVDIRMPGMSGIELLQSIRAGWGHVAVIILTGHGDLDSAMAAVRAGAHDPDGARSGQNVPPSKGTGQAHRGHASRSRSYGRPSR